MKDFYRVAVITFLIAAFLNAWSENWAIAIFNLLIVRIMQHERDKK